MSIETNLTQIREKIKNSARRANRNPAAITLIAVTKYVDPVAINRAISCGITDIGENRVQEAVAKFPLLNGPVVKHLIGTLQSNKVRTAIENFDLIHSVDRRSLVAELAKQAGKLQKRIKILIELNISGEDTKHGIAPEELPDILKTIGQSENLLPCGLMTMAPLAAAPEETRLIFRRLRELFETVRFDSGIAENWRYLSMGMSRDYEIAVEEGANLLRIGTAIFKS